MEELKPCDCGQELYPETIEKHGRKCALCQTNEAIEEAIEWLLNLPPSGDVSDLTDKLENAKERLIHYIYPE